MTVRFPVQNYYAEVRAEKAPSLPAPAETHLALVRRHYVVHTYPLTALEHRLLSALVEGRAVGEAIEEVGAVAGRRPGGTGREPARLVPALGGAGVLPGGGASARDR